MKKEYIMHKLLTKCKNKTPEMLKQLNQALDILISFGIPMEGKTQRQLECMALCFIAVSGITVKKSWSEVKSNDDNHRLKSREIINYLNENYNENISSGSYDDIRRKHLKPLTIDGVVMLSAANPNAARNNPTRAFALDPIYADTIRKYGTKDWSSSLKGLMKNKVTLKEKLSNTRVMEMIPIEVASGKILEFTPAEHNQLQKQIVEEFLKRYGFGASVLYVGDAADKFKFIERTELEKLGFFELNHGELPDVVAYSKSKNWIYLVEAVHSANPISSMRHLELKRLTKDCKAGVVYITAFLDRSSFKKFVAEISWETEVWIASEPDHLIHFNGKRFLGPYEDS